MQDWHPRAAKALLTMFVTPCVNESKTVSFSFFDLTH